MRTAFNRNRSTTFVSECAEMPHIEEICSVVQRNCDISDAAHARDYTMCVYLLKMREYYRWSKGLGFDSTLPVGDLGHWVEQREQFWDSLEDSEYQCVPLAGSCVEPFDAQSINRSLSADGLIYGGGFGRFGKPHFFLARLAESRTQDGVTIYVAGKEHARDLSPPPGMSQAPTIIVRLESPRRVLWERVQEWGWQKNPGPMAKVVEHYGFERDPDAALDRMVEAEMETVILHELGEVAAGKRLGPSWGELIAAVSGTRAEMLARAVRDHLADSLVTLPALLDRGEPAPLHFDFANLTDLRRTLAPLLSEAYNTWAGDSRSKALPHLAAAAAEHWEDVARQMLDGLDSEDVTSTVESVAEQA
ncbi:MAG: hypothetical protein DRQ37_08590, partial [Gammaproteobacteria bacterium]